MSRVLRLVHVADVHLDTPFRARSEAVRARLAEAVWTALERAVELARAEDCDALLLAGDVFDSERVTAATEARLVSLLAGLAEDGIAVALATGNHDPGGEDGRLGALAGRDGVALFDRGEPRTVVLRDRGGRVVGHLVGVGHDSPHESASLAARFPGRPGPEPTVGLMHALVVGARGSERHDRYAPCTLRELAAFDGDYWALGHVHTRQAVSDDPVAWYPGNLQGRHFGETGARGALIVEVTAGGGAEVAFAPLAPVRWEEVVLSDLAAVARAPELAARAAEAFAALRGDDADGVEDWMLRLVLRGVCPLEEELRDEGARRDLERVLARELGALELEIDASGLLAPHDYDALAARDDLLGAALRDLGDRRRAEDPLAELALDRLASRAAREDPRGLLEGVEALVVEALVVEALRPGGAR
ncbi:MAG: DNA repair exonuclease [Planctomycetota bacterium]